MENQIRKIAPRVESVSYNVIQLLGEKETYSIGAKYGMYRSSEIISKRLKAYVSPYVMRYLSRKYNGVRIISDRTLPLVKGILAGTMPAEYYKHIIIKEESKNE